ncbi:aBC-type polysaccharide/polyol phosphate transport system ATPase component [Clostridium sp. CAG:524]|jgi:teichoic acid transport system ATP-binding protein|nr:aBC-type polysaccharide/polyol phosphate transport system ATPase component [Clostridium sp. CAG:524]
MKKQEIAISVNDLHVYYRDMNRFSLKKGGLKSRGSGKIFKAVKGVTFEVPKGQILGICGKNGSGKSTLLRAISGIFSADKGSINLHGNSISLLSIGVGFQKQLTGYENIFLSGMLLGYSKEQIEEKVKDIIEFSELGDFIYKPVRSYSSGMYSKLAFSITAILETDIMLIDEVLSVGDIHFKEKSYNKMKELISDDKRTVVIVSHNSKTIIELCDKVIWLHEGLIKDEGDPETIMNEYEQFMRNEG